MKLKKRVIVTIFYRNGKIVQSYKFNNYKVVGNPTYIVKRINQWDLDELIYLDLSTMNSDSYIRRDIPQSINLNFQDAIKMMSKNTYSPLSVGGKINSIEQVQDYLNLGADKVVINSSLFENSSLIPSITNTYGSQVLIAAVDYRWEGLPIVYKNGGREKTNWVLSDWLLNLQDLGVGEILLNCIEKDGTKTGFDLKVIDVIPKKFQIPIILLGGAGKYNDFKSALSMDSVHSIAAGNFFLHEDQSYYNLKRRLISDNMNVRNSEIYIEKFTNEIL